MIKTCRQDEGLHGIRFFYPRWTSLNRAMKKADAEIYYHNCAEYVTGQVALWCRLHGRSCIYSVANDTECERISPETRKIHDRLFFRYGLRKANQIIVQTQKQQQMLLNNFGLQSVILPMPCAGPNHDYHKPPIPEKGDYNSVLWVGRIDKQKRLGLLLDVAEALPEVVFDIVGKPSNSDDPYSMNILARATTLPNVNVHGMVSRGQITHFYKNACLLCCTSLYEGFPNTFLEAWSCGLPIVSTFEPDKLISNKNLGIFAKNRLELISGIKTLFGSQPLWQKMSENARRYFEENHSLDQSMRRFENLFLKIRSMER